MSKMQRSIKFRVWDREKKNWNAAFVDSFKNPTINPQYVLQQYTGLKDKNGKELYEGDVVKVSDNWDLLGWAAGEKGEVIYTDTAKFCLQTKSGRFTFENDGDKYLEVVGNIYENPELVK